MTGARPAEMVTHPLAVAALITLIVNDHLLKARFHHLLAGHLTGKLSDVAGLAVFPILVVGGIEVGRWMTRRPPPRRGPSHLVAALVTVVAFGAIQTVGPATEAYRHLAAVLIDGPVSVTADPTDLLTAPAALLGWLLVERDQRLTGHNFSRPVTVL